MGMEVSLEGVTVDYARRGLRVLDDVNLNIGSGEHVALLGPSGAGKTTLLRVLLGFARPVAGQVRVGGGDPFGSWSDATALRRQTGFVRQRDDLVRGLSARTNILMGEAYRWRLWDWLTVARGAVPGRYVERLSSLAERHRVHNVLDMRVDNLSGGQRQRVALVRALLSGPGLLLADEMTTGLDPSRAAAAIRHLRDADGATLVVATHDLTVARRFPRIVAVRDGRIALDGSELGERDVQAIYGEGLSGDEGLSGYEDLSESEQASRPRHDKQSDTEVR
jgi:ABC-type phosphate/phosphonate transport system ATPase subunit